MQVAGCSAEASNKWFCNMCIGLGDMDSTVGAVVEFPL